MSEIEEKGGICGAKERTVERKAACTTRNGMCFKQDVNHYVS